MLQDGGVAVLVEMCSLVQVGLVVKVELLVQVNI